MSATENSIDTNQKSLHVVHKNEAFAKKQHAIESEECILGGLILDNGAYQSICNIISEHDFYSDDHKTIYGAIKTHGSSGEPFDIFTLSHLIDIRGGLKESATIQYLAALARDTPSAATVVEHAKIVRKYSLERKAKVALANGNFAELGNICNEINNLSNGFTVKSSLKMIDEVIDRPMTHDWLVKGWIERKQTCVLWGASQSYKSLLAIDIACAIATGMEWRSNKVKQGAVLYIVGEGGGSGISRRFKAWSIANNVDLKGAPIIVREASTILPVHTDQLIKEVEELLKERGLTLELVILDTLSRTMAGDENSQKDFNEYQHALDVIRDKFQCAVMFLHHIGHGDKTRARGASAIRCNVDVELSMETVGDKVSKLHAWKVKDSSASEDMCFQLTVVDLGCIDEDGKQITSVVLRNVENQVTNTTKSTVKLSNAEHIAMRTLKRMTESCGNDVLVTEWRTRYSEELKISDPEMKQDTIKKSWQRAIAGLQTKNLVTLTGIEDTTAYLAAQTGQTGRDGTKRDNVPVVPGQTGHTSLEVSRLSRQCPDRIPVEAGNRDDSPDFGTSDDGYWNSLLTEGN